jgi:hypothetical protein
VSNNRTFIKPAASQSVPHMAFFLNYVDKKHLEHFSYIRYRLVVQMTVAA